MSFLDARDDEHPPEDIQRGQAFVSRAVNAIRSGPYWKDSVIFITYDEHDNSHTFPGESFQLDALMYPQKGKIYIEFAKATGT